MPYTTTYDRVTERLEARDSEAWQEIASDPTAAPAFLEAYRKHAPAGISPRFVAHYDGGRLVAGAPLFDYSFRIDTPLGAGMRAVGDWLMRVAPRLVQVPLVCIGSPLTDDCGLAFAPGLDSDGQRDAFAGLVDATLEHARDTTADVIAVKDVRAAHAGIVHPVLVERGFSRIPSLPLAMLDLPFRSFDAYLAQLSPKMRSDLRRKMRQSRSVEIGFEEASEALEGEIARLLGDTRARRKADFGDLDIVPARLVLSIAQVMAPAARLVVTRIDGRIAGFNLLLTKGERAIAYRIGLDSELTREHNLYFANWIWLVRHCIDNGLSRLEMGQTSYGLKQRLGCTLEPSWIYCRHRNRGWNQVFKWVTPRVSLARMDPDLAQH